MVTRDLRELAGRGADAALRGALGLAPAPLPPTPTLCLPDGQAEGCPHPPNVYPFAASCTEAQCFPPTAWTRGYQSRAVPDAVPVNMRPL